MNHPKILFHRARCQATFSAWLIFEKSGWLLSTIDDLAGAGAGLAGALGIMAFTAGAEVVAVGLAAAGGTEVVLVPP